MEEALAAEVREAAVRLEELVRRGAVHGLEIQVRMSVAQGIRNGVRLTPRVDVAVRVAIPDWS